MDLRAYHNALNQGFSESEASRIGDDAWENNRQQPTCDPQDRQQHEASPQGRGGVMDVIDELIAYCEAWEPWARVMGNVCAGDAAQALRSLRAELAELRRFRKVIMDYDSNLYDALANSDAARKGEGE